MRMKIYKRYFYFAFYNLILFGVMRIYCHDTELFSFCSNYIKNYKKVAIEYSRESVNPFITNDLKFNEKFCIDFVKFANFNTRACIQQSTERLFKYSTKLSNFQLYLLSFFVSFHTIAAEKNLHLSSFFSKFNMASGRAINIITDLTDNYLMNNDKGKTFINFITLFAKEYFFNFPDLIEMNKKYNFFSYIISNDEDVFLKEKLNNPFSFDKTKNKNYYLLYMPNPKGLLSIHRLNSFLREFMKFSCKMICECNEFKFAKSILPELGLLSKHNIYYMILLNDFNPIHDFLSYVLLKTRFISFVLFGEYNKLFKLQYLPKYKLKIIKRLRFDMINMYLSFAIIPSTVEFFKISTILKKVRIDYGKDLN